jgi:hypothetical protein
VLRELTSRGPVLVASRRADASRPDFVGTRVRRLELGPLSVAALQRIVSDRLGVTFSRPTLVRLADASRGNAFFALEIASHPRPLTGGGSTVAVECSSGGSSSAAVHLALVTIDALN